MDTALALMEAKEPVYPLDIVQAMRDQRASMVQNVVRISRYNWFIIKLKTHSMQAQYKFVCECIVAAYNKILEEEDTKQSSNDT